MGRRLCHRVALHVVAVLIALCALPIASLRADEEATAGTLATLRRDVRQGSPKAPQEDDKPEVSRELTPTTRPLDVNATYHWRADGEREEEAEPDNFLTTTLLLAVSAPFWLPAAAVGDQYTFESEFLDYPYQCGQPGEMIMRANPNSPSKPWLVRVAGEYGDDFDRLAFGRGHVLLDTCRRFGIDTEWAYRREELRPVAVGGNSHDDLWTGDANLVFRFAETEWLQMRAGIGINWLADDAGGDVGFNFTYGGDLLPCDPWIISAEIDWGKIGHAGLFHGRLTVGVQIDAIEFYTGYDYFDVGTAQSDAIVAGVRLWF
jgi:hypothetical protein